MNPTMTTPPATTREPESRWSPRARNDKCGGQVAEHRDPVIDRTVDASIKGRRPKYFRTEWPSITHSLPIRPNKLARSGRPTQHRTVAASRQRDLSYAATRRTAESRPPTFDMAPPLSKISERALKGDCAAKSVSYRGGVTRLRRPP
jgi:hypothetical protein